jgi:tRNA pseudouridine65 synthase
MKQSPIGTPSILYEDEQLCVVYKPNRMLVHRTAMDYYEDTNLRRWLAAEVGTKIDPVHRLDKPTSGLVLFAKDKDTLNALKQQFLDHTVEKTYLAVVRGYTAAEGTIDKPLQADKALEAKEALTAYRTLQHIEVEAAVSRYPTSRYSWVEVKPQTGRFHQIRLHFAHLRHPVIGDTRHGDRKHNHFFRDALELQPLFLHAHSLRFQHPKGDVMEIRASLPEHFRNLRDRWSWQMGAGVSELD